MSLEVLSETYTLQVVEEDVELVVENALTEIVEVETQGPPGMSNLLNAFVEDETPTGLIDGSNAVFITAFNFIPESVEVWIRGLKQRRVTDFFTTGNTVINFTDSPLVGDNILVSYRRA